MTVKMNDEGSFDFVCDRPSGCGDHGASFSSRKWETAEQAEARGVEHEEEHRTGTPMSELVDFERSVGFAADGRNVR